MDLNSDAIRRIERAEERLNQTEREVSAVTSELHILREDVHRRLGDLKTDLIDKADDNKEVFKDRVESIRRDLNDNINSITATIRVLNENVTQTSESLQNLYAHHKSSSVKVNTNEKIIWAVIGVIGTGGLYLLQEFLRRGAGH